MYCMKCRAKKEVEAPEKVMNKKGFPMLKAECPDCKTKMYKFIKRS